MYLNSWADLEVAIGAARCLTYPRPCPAPSKVSETPPAQSSELLLLLLLLLPLAVQNPLLALEEPFICRRCRLLVTQPEPAVSLRSLCV